MDLDARFRADLATRPAGEVLFGHPRDAYDRLRRVNWSTLKLLGRSPAHYQHALLATSPDTDARKLGRAVHVAVLEPDRFAGEFVEWDGGARRGKDWQAFRDDNPGREILTTAEADECRALAAAVRADPTAAEYLTEGEAEFTLTWTAHVPAADGVPAADVECRARPDWVSRCRPALLDLKSTRDASPEGFGRELWRYRYHVQAAWYADAYEAATGDRLPFLLVAVEKVEPYVVQTYRVPERVLEAGREEYRALLARLVECRHAGRWPGYATGEVEVTMPAWTGFADDEDVSELGLVIGGGDRAA